MNRTDIAKEMHKASDSNITIQQCKDILDTALATIVKDAHNGNKTILKGFGTFSQKIRKSRLGRNPATGESITIPEVKTIHFKPSDSIKIKK